MALAKRNDIDDADPQARHLMADHAYEESKRAASLQAEFLDQLRSQGVTQGPVLVASSAERMVRFLSVAGGYAALMVGYAAVALVIARSV